MNCGTLLISLLIFKSGNVDGDGAQEIIKLAKLNLDPSTVTVSGFSAGSSMATQFHVAHSAEISGAGLFSQAFYRCGPRSLIEFGLRCSNQVWDLVPYNVKCAIQNARDYSAKGVIDPVGNLNRSKVFIWTGAHDEYLSPGTVIKNQDFYRAFITNPANINLTVANAKHLFPTNSYGVACSQNAEHTLYLGNCNYSGAAHALGFLLGDLEIPPGTGQLFDEGQLKVFDQTEFYRGPNISSVGMGTLGHIYVPKVCAGAGLQKCRVHFNFHGCNEWPLDLARSYVLNNGFLPVAELNSIVVIFPLTTAIPTNYNGCWDFFSYTNSKFATKEGEQIQVVYRMLQRLLKGI